MEFTINKSFQTKVQRTKRVMECAEAFGLGLDSKEFHVYRDLKLNIEPGDIIYITGQSGSGKSILLRELEQMLPKEKAFGDAMNIDDVELLDKPIIDQVGKSNEEGNRILAAAGLSDAYLLIRTPAELSDGQLYRFRIAKMMESGAKVWIADEFGAVLDRITAKAVSYNLHKQAVRAGATVVVATTHRDLRNELAPNLYIEKRYQEQLKIVYGDEEEVVKAA